MARVDMIGVLEAAYEIIEHDTDEKWARAVVRAMPALVPFALGTNAFFYDSSMRPIRTWAAASHASALDSEMLSAAVATTSERMSRGLIAASVSVGSELAEFAAQPAVESILRPRGIEDILVLNAANPDGSGFVVGHPLSRRRTPSAKERTTLDRVAAHVASAFRLRRRLHGARKEPAAAVVSPDGNVLHAEGDARLEAHRRRLRDAVRHIEAVRSATGQENPDEGIRQWLPLVSARWTLVDRFENDGKRFVVACANEPDTRPHVELSPRERQVVGLLSLGHHPKLVAYELGISHATVRVLMARAARRLGVRTRGELIRKASGSKDA